MKVLFVVMSVLAFALIAPWQGHTLEFVADGTGYDVGYTPDFWGVSFVSGAGYITSVTLSLPGSAYWDFDGSPFLATDPANPYTPMVLGVEPVMGALNGLTASDISYPHGTIASPLGHPTSLTFDFSSSAFGPGDWFRFSADVDGGPLEGTLATVQMLNGDSYSADFRSVSATSVVARINDSQSVPEPSMFLLLGCGLFGLSRYKKRVFG
jgi:hypothetical protein